MRAGVEGTLGPTATLQIGGVAVLIISYNSQMLDLEMFLSNGINPSERRIVAVKSMHHFRAAFEPISCGVLVVDSGALCSPDRTRLTYRRVRRPLYPLDSAQTCMESMRN